MELQQAIDLIRYPELSTGGPAVWADLGAGSGLFSMALSKLLPPGSTIYAVDKRQPDISPNNQGLSVIHPRQMDFEKEEWRFGMLNGIIAANSLHFVKHQAACIKKWTAFLPPAAEFIIVEYNTSIATRWVPYPLPFDALESLFSPLGYRKITLLHKAPSVYNNAGIYAARVSR